MKSSPELSLSIGEVAERFDLPTHVLRHWETEGLLRPARDAGGRRRYREDDIVRLAVIRRSRSAGMSIAQIAVMLDRGLKGRHEALFAHLADLDRRMQEIALAREMTAHAIECEAHDILACPSFRAHVDDLLVAQDRSETA